jgi:hypothetical protein
VTSSSSQTCCHTLLHSNSGLTALRNLQRLAIHGKQRRRCGCVSLLKPTCACTRLAFWMADDLGRRGSDMPQLVCCNACARADRRGGSCGSSSSCSGGSGWKKPSMSGASNGLHQISSPCQQQKGCSIKDGKKSASLAIRNTRHGSTKLYIKTHSKPNAGKYRLHPRLVTQNLRRCA